MIRKNVKRVIAVFAAMVIGCILWAYVQGNVSALQSRTDYFNRSYSIDSDPGQYMVNIAFAQKGKTGAQLNYSEDWCADFVSDCATLAGQSSVIPHRAVVRDLANAVNGSVTNSPRVGDLCIFDWNSVSGPYDHVEIVYQVSGNTVYTIGGNAGSTGNCRTNYVKTRNATGTGQVQCYIHPNYDGSTGTPPANDDELGIGYPRPSGNPLLSTGSTGSGVSWLQTALNKANNAGLAVDGDFGSGTKQAVINFQNAYGLEADGIAGPATINKLVEVIKGHNDSEPSYDINLNVDPGTDLQVTNFSWNNVPTAIKYGIRIYEADNWDNQIYSNWNHIGYNDSIQLNSGNYMGQCMYLTTEGEDWIFGDMTYFSVKTTNLILNVNPGTDLQVTNFSWNNVPTAIKYGIRIYEADNWDNQVYSNWNHIGYNDSIQLNSGNYMGQCMYLTTEGEDWIFGDMTYFSVKTTNIITPTISTDKTSYVVGDTINITWKASASNSLLSHYWLVVKDPNGTEIIGETMGKNTSYSFTVDKSGEYTIITYATPLGSKEGEGSLMDTKKITVTRPIKGDLNADNKLTISDAVLLQKWLLSIPNTTLTDWQAGDMNGNGTLNGIDLCLMKQALLAKSPS